MPHVGLELCDRMSSIHVIRFQNLLIQSIKRREKLTLLTLYKFHSKSIIMWDKSIIIMVRVKVEEGYMVRPRLGLDSQFTTCFGKFPNWGVGKLIC